MLAFFFSPSGRIGRAQWWLSQLAVIAFVIIAVFFMVILLGATEQARMAAAVPLGVSLVAVTLMLLWMGFCLTVKRYHDRGKSAWWLLIMYVPVLLLSALSEVASMSDPEAGAGFAADDLRQFEASA